MTEYINDGGYGEKQGVYHFKFTPREFICPRAFWSQYSIYLERLYSIFNNAVNDFRKSHSWKECCNSKGYGKLGLYRLFVSIRLDNSLRNDAENAGLYTEKDIINYYNDKKQV